MITPYTFLCYSRSDSEFALKIVREIRKAGGNIWMDKDIRTGKRWDIEVEKALYDCESVLVILSPASVNSYNVLDEISFALDENKMILPLVISKCPIPLRIRRFQHIDFSKDFEQGLNEVYEALNIEHPNDNRNKYSKGDTIEKPEIRKAVENRTVENDHSEKNWICSTNNKHRFSEKEAEKNGYFCPTCPSFEGILIYAEMAAATIGRVKASPLAKKMAADRGIDIGKVNGSGDNGRIIKKDIDTYDPRGRK